MSQDGLPMRLLAHAEPPRFMVRSSVDVMEILNGLEETMIKAFARDMFTHASLGPMLREQVIYRMRNPEPDGQFVTFSDHIRSMSDHDALQSLLRGGYDGILFVGDLCIEVVGEAYFQAQNGGKELHLFGWYVHPHREGHGIGAELIEDFLTYAWNKGFRTVRMSAGGEKSAPLLHVLDKATKDQLNIKGFRVLHGGGEGPGYATLVAA